MKKACDKTATAIIVIGIIITIFSFLQRAHIALIISNIISMGILSMILYSIAELLEKTENMHSDIAQLKTYVENVERNKELELKVKNGDAWRCNNCSRINLDYIRCCSCGKKQEDNINPSM